MASRWVLPLFLLLVVLAMVFTHSDVGLKPTARDTIPDVFRSRTPDLAPIPPELPYYMYLVHENYVCHDDCFYNCRGKGQLSGGCVQNTTAEQCMCQCYLRVNGPNGGDICQSLAIASVTYHFLASCRRYL